jgi:hypothetical protein
MVQGMAPVLTAVVAVWRSVQQAGAPDRQATTGPVLTSGVAACENDNSRINSLMEGRAHLPWFSCPANFGDDVLAGQCGLTLSDLPDGVSCLLLPAARRSGSQNGVGDLNPADDFLVVIESRDSPHEMSMARSLDRQSRFQIGWHVLTESSLTVHAKVTPVMQPAVA